jgi:hypothetical protein
VKHLLIVALCLLATPAWTQVKRPAVTGDPIKDIQTDIKGGTTTAPSIGGVSSNNLDPQVLIKKIVALAGPDLLYAVALAKNANTASSGVRLQCLVAIQILNSQVTGSALKNTDGTAMTAPTDVHIFTDLEQAAEAIDAISPTGPLFTSCAGAAALAGMGVIQFINAAVAGTAAAAIVIPK